MCAVLSRVAPMPPLITKIVRCDERSRLKCNKNLAGSVLFEFEQYV
jgi:hypothetical protein